MINDVNQSTYCTLAFTGYDSRCKSMCCWAKHPGQPQSYAELSSMPEIKQLRQDMIDGIKNPICNYCYEKEQTIDGEYTMRVQHTKHLSPQTIAGEIKNPRLKTLVIDSGNVCNLACRTCGPQSSSGWWRETEYRNTKKQPQLVSCHKKTDLKSALNEDFSSIQFVNILGGEPFQNLDHVQILEHIIRQGNASACDLSYTTNATVKLPLHIKKIFTYFRSVGLTASIDAVGLQFEYIRTNGRWQDVIHNINDWKRLPNVGINAHPVISALNVLYLEDLYDWFTAQNMKWSIVLCEWPMAYSFRIFTSQQKRKIISQLEESKHRLIHQSLIDYITRVPYDPQALKQFLDENENTQEFRHLAIADYLPELVNLLKTE